MQYAGFPTALLHGRNGLVLVLSRTQPRRAKALSARPASGKSRQQLGCLERRRQQQGSGFLPLRKIEGFSRPVVSYHPRKTAQDRNATPLQSAPRRTALLHCWFLARDKNFVRTFARIDVAWRLRWRRSSGRSPQIDHERFQQHHDQGPEGMVPFRRPRSAFLPGLKVGAGYAKVPRNQFSAALAPLGRSDRAEPGPMCGNSGGILPALSAPATVGRPWFVRTAASPVHRKKTLHTAATTQELFAPWMANYKLWARAYPLRGRCRLSDRSKVRAKKTPGHRRREPDNFNFKTVSVGQNQARFLS